MEIKKKSAVYALQEENEKFTVSGDLTIDNNGRPTFNGSVRSKAYPDRGFTCFYQDLGNNNVSYSTSGCPNCEVGSAQFVYDTISKAVKTVSQPEPTEEVAQVEVTEESHLPDSGTSAELQDSAVSPDPIASEGEEQGDENNETILEG